MTTLTQIIQEYENNFHCDNHDGVKYWLTKQIVELADSAYDRFMESTDEARMKEWRDELLEL